MRGYGHEAKGMAPGSASVPAGPPPGTAHRGFKSQEEYERGTYAAQLRASRWLPCIVCGPSSVGEHLSPHWPDVAFCREHEGVSK